MLEHESICYGVGTLDIFQAKDKAPASKPLCKIFLDNLEVHLVLAIISRVNLFKYFGYFIPWYAS